MMYVTAATYGGQPGQWNDLMGFNYPGTDQLY